MTAFLFKTLLTISALSSYASVSDSSSLASFSNSLSEDAITGFINNLDNFLFLYQTRYESTFNTGGTWTDVDFCLNRSSPQNYWWQKATAAEIAFQVKIISGKKYAAQSFFFEVQYEKTLKI